jgi:hypothetical protein
VLNAYVLWNNREAFGSVWRRVLPIVIGLVPGVVVGTAIVAQVNPSWLRFATFTTLLPLILVQAAGFRRPIQAERAAGLIFGGGLGVLYSVTTISGPPLAIVLNNQGFAKKDFRAALGIIRLAESSMTAVAYAYVGFYTATSIALIPWIVPSILVGVPIGAVIIRRVAVETFRRVCMSFDALVVGFGLSRLLNELGLVAGPAAYTVLVVTAIVNIWLLYRFFSRQRVDPLPPQVVQRAARIEPWRPPRGSPADSP